MSNQTCLFSCGKADEDLLSSMEFARMRRAKSDPWQSKRTCTGTESDNEDRFKENPLDEDGLSDSELEDDYEFDKMPSCKQSDTPAFPPNIEPSLSAHMPVGAVAETTSNPIMFFYCAVPAQLPGAFNVPFQYYGQMSSMNSNWSPMCSPMPSMNSNCSPMPSINSNCTTMCTPMPSVGSNCSSMPSMHSIVSQASLELSTVSSISSCNGDARPGGPPKCPPGTFDSCPTLLTSKASTKTGHKNQPRCRGVADDGSKLSLPSAKQMGAERTKRNLRHNAKHTESARTTVMLRNLPSYFSRDMLLELLHSLGFANKYDFINMPADLVRLSCLGFAFVNFRTHEDALQFFKKAHGFDNWQRASCKVLEVSWSNPLQGLAAQIQRYRNATVMHPSVPEQCKPMLFGKDGERIAFPKPTSEIRPPRSN